MGLQLAYLTTFFTAQALFARVMHVAVCDRDAHTEWALHIHT